MALRHLRGIAPAACVVGALAAALLGPGLEASAVAQAQPQAQAPLIWDWGTPGWDEYGTQLGELRLENKCEVLRRVTVTTARTEYSSPLHIWGWRSGDWGGGDAPPGTYRFLLPARSMLVLKIQASRPDTKPRVTRPDGSVTLGRIAVDHQGAPNCLPAYKEWTIVAKVS